MVASVPLEKIQRWPRKTAPHASATHCTQKRSGEKRRFSTAQASRPKIITSAWTVRSTRWFSRARKPLLGLVRATGVCLLPRRGLGDPKPQDRVRRSAGAEPLAQRLRVGAGERRSVRDAGFAQPRGPAVAEEAHAREARLHRRERDPR